ncbi:MAG: holo-ACP synthase [Betaproteobacteria bacterium]|nr:holo-ACP synthase [Betaproteobacteria bacterium]
MIAGIGIDLVEVARIGQLHARYGERLEARLLGAAERAQLPSAAAARRRRLATCFAAKEAFAKAIGTGLRPPATLQAIEVVRDQLGAPSFRLAAPLASLLADRAITASHLSISDTDATVVAVAVIEQANGQ